MQAVARAGTGQHFVPGTGDRVGDDLRLPRRREQVLLPHHHEGGRRDPAEPVERVVHEVGVPLLDGHLHLFLVLWEGRQHRFYLVGEIRRIEGLRGEGEPRSPERCLHVTRGVRMPECGEHRPLKAVRTAPGGVEHHAQHAVGVGQRKLLRGGRSQRPADDMRLGHRQRLQQRGGVLGQ